MTSYVRNDHRRKHLKPFSYYIIRETMSEEDRKSALKFLVIFIAAAVVLAVIFLIILPGISVGPTGY